MILICGPCSIHDPAAARDYARRLKALASRVDDVFVVVMRTYFEKPRTVDGWKGLIYEPGLDGKEGINEGIRTARKLLLYNAGLGLLSGTEFVDPAISPYIADAVSWAAIGARTVQSPIHRALASLLPMPVGFKNSTDGSVQAAINAVLAAKNQQMLSLGDSFVTSGGNAHTHIILRGGERGTNYDAESVKKAQEALRSNRLSHRLMIDCSHGNSGKNHAVQASVFMDVVMQRAEGNDGIVGVMVESNIKEGNQPVGDRGKGLVYGVSVTDPCIGWEATEKMVIEAHRELRRREV